VTDSESIDPASKSRFCDNRHGVVVAIRSLLVNLFWLSNAHDARPLHAPWENQH